LRRFFARASASAVATATSQEDEDDFDPDPDDELSDDDLERARLPTTCAEIIARHENITDMLARSFLNHFNNAFLNTIEKIRTPHLDKVVGNLRDFAGKVPPKYRESIEKAFRTEGFLSFLLARASVSLLCAKATMPRHPGRPAQQLGKEHEQLATVVEELYIAAMLHAEEQWDTELKADGKTFIAVAAAFVGHLTDTSRPDAPLRRQNIQSAILGFDANPMVWSKYGLDMLGLSFHAAFGISSSPPASSSRKVSLLGGDSLYATAQWAMANLDSRACRKLIAETIAQYSDGQLRKRELLWFTGVTIRQYLDLEKYAGVATFFGASSACAALVNGVDEEISNQMAEFGYDLGLVVGLLKDTRSSSIESALRRGRISAPVIYALQQDKKLRELLERKLERPGDLEEAVTRVKTGGLASTMLLVNRLSARAAARLECLSDSEEKEALLTLTFGIGCLPLVQVPDVVKDSCFVHEDERHRSEGKGSLRQPRHKERFDLKIENLRLRATLSRLESQERRNHARLDGIQKVASGEVVSAPRPRPIVGLGVENDTTQIDWLLLRGLERRAPLPESLDLESLLSCIAPDQQAVQERLMALSTIARSRKLKKAVKEVFHGGGKRLRPALCHLVHRMLRVPFHTRGAKEDVLKLATAVEIIHTASLVHDDILDDADTRRQRKTVHQVFGPDVAVLSGDFLFAHASGMIESLENDEVTRLVSLVIEQFGYGELSQSSKQFDVEVPLLDYMKKSFYKTASLLAAACRASAVLTGPSREVCDVMYSYGFYLGVAFQIADDILDFVGSDEEMGKPRGQDLREGLLTAPVILCITGNADLGIGPSPHANELRRLVNSRFSGGPADLERAVALVWEDGGVDKAYLLADKMANKALEALMLAAPLDSDARRSLAGLTRWAVRRTS